MRRDTSTNKNQQQYTPPRIRFVQFDTQDIITSSPFPPDPPGPGPNDNRAPFCSLDN